MLASRMYILLAALLWSTAGACIKLSDLTSWQLAGGRSIVAAMVLFLLLPDARRRPTGHVWWVAMAYAATVVLFVLANKLTTAANAIFIQDCAPVYVLILSPYLLGERPTRRELLAVPVFAAGLIMFFLDQITPGQWTGNMIALASGVAFALCIMGLRRVGDGGNRAAAWGNILAFCVSLPFMIGGPNPATKDIAIVLFLDVFQLACAYAAFSRGLKGVSAVEASLLVLLEPVLSSLWAFLFAGEQPGPWAMRGGAIILFATLWRTFGAARNAATTT